MAVDNDLISVQQARDMVEAAHRAQVALARFDQTQIDIICEAMANAALREAKRLGQMAHDETGYGVPADKATKNRFAAQDVWNYFRGLKTVGVVSESESVVEIASPRGVVAAIIPSTNPTSTAIFKCLISIKSRNAVVLSPHPSAARCIAESARVVKDAAVRAGMPADAIQCMTETSLQGTEALMKHKLTAVILATGGTGLVRAAYSSGKPAFGVGPGNVPVFIERTADVGKAVQDILTGTCFDNGTICASEQAVVVDAPVAAEVRAQFTAQGAHFLNPAEADAVAKVLLTEQRTLNPGIVGKPAEYIARLAGVSVPAGTRCLLADCGGVGRDFPWSVEKLSPTLAFFVADGAEQGAARCHEILRFGGMGHTAGMHTRSREAAVAYGAQMPASRIVINSPTTHGAIGFSTALPPSMTLGCGSWGGNVTSDNVSPLHLMDIKRVAFEVRPVANSRPAQSRQTVSVMSPLLNTQQAPQMQVPLTVAAPQPPSNHTPSAIIHNIAPQLSAAPQQPHPGANSAAVSRANIAALVDKFLAARPIAAAHDASSNSNTTQTVEAKPGVKIKSAISNGNAAAQNGANNHTAKKNVTDFVCEDDVRRALDKGEKIYVNNKTIITPAARDMGDAAEIFAKR